MSNVTNIILLTSRDDDGIKALQDWLDAQGKPILKEISNHAGGNKGFGVQLWAAAINYLREDLFIRTVEAINWKEPEFMQLLIKGEMDDVFRIAVDGGHLPRLREDGRLNL
jgi:hypothetical protein